MRKPLWILVAALAFSLPAMAEGWKKLDGLKVPDFEAKTWLNTGKETPTAASMRGKVYLLEFFATW